MRRDLEARLYRKYPKLFRQRDLSMRETGMCWGIDCGSGWFELLDALCSKIVKLAPNCQVTQVKEKFGTLRFYCDYSTDVVEAAIREAEEESARTCEECGAPGKERRGGWVQTLCDACDEKRNKK